VVSTSGVFIGKFRILGPSASNICHCFIFDFSGFEAAKASKVPFLVLF
jgi:hypothetical protein